MSSAVRACSKKDIAVVATAVYMDPDLMLRSEHPHIDLNNPAYAASMVCQRNEILAVTTAPDALPVGVVARALDPRRMLAFELLVRDEMPSPSVAAFIDLAADAQRPAAHRALAAVA